MVNKKRGLIVGTTAFVLTSIALTGAGIRLSQTQAFFRESPKELVDEVWQIVNRQYVDATFNQVDWRAVRTQYLERDYASKEEAYTAIKDMLATLEDPYTRFMNPEEFNNMKVDTSGELTGVGIQISKDEEKDQLIVVSPIEDTPAFEAGILAQDIIVKIDGKSTEGMELNDAVDLIRGKEGTTVILTIRRGEEEIDYPLKRTSIQIHPVRAGVVETDIGKVGYIRLTQFSAQASGEMKDAIQELGEEKITGYILDLRSNPGGLLISSVDIARMWYNSGKIVSTVNRIGELEVHNANNTALTDKPLVVLVDGGSASASEILAGALQDHDRAVIVGTQTFGKGLVQSVRGLGDGSGLAVTIAKYLTPDGRDINKEGIEPDIIYEMTEEERKALQQDRTKIGSLSDPQFSKAVEVLQQTVTATQSPSSQE